MPFCAQYSPGRCRQKFCRGGLGNGWQRLLKFLIAVADFLRIVVTIRGELIRSCR